MKDCEYSQNIELIETTSSKLYKTLNKKLELSFKFEQDYKELDKDLSGVTKRIHSRLKVMKNDVLNFDILKERADVSLMKCILYTTKEIFYTDEKIKQLKVDIQSNTKYDKLKAQNVNRFIKVWERIFSHFKIEDKDLVDELKLIEQIKSMCLYTINPERYKEIVKIEQERLEKLMDEEELEDSLT